MNGSKIADVIRRFNLFLNDGNWLSLNPSSVKVIEKDKHIYFGEVNEDNKFHGKGIDIWFNSHTFIGNFNNGKWAPGNYLEINSKGEFHVGEYYMKDG